MPAADGRCLWCDTQTGASERAEVPPRAVSRPRKISEEVLQEARQLYASGLSFRAVARQVVDRTEYANANVCATMLGSIFKTRGWPRRDQRQATADANWKHGNMVGGRRAPGYRKPCEVARRRPLCAGVRLQYPRKGEPCQVAAMRGSEFCQAHDPERRHQVLEHVRAMRERKAAA